MTTPATRKVAQYKLEQLKGKPGQSEVEKVKASIEENAAQGWELVEACGDEIRMPVLVYMKAESPHSKDEYRVEAVTHARGENEMDALRNVLIDYNEQGWLLLTVLDYPMSPPIAIWRKVEKTPAVNKVQVVLVPIGVFSNTEQAIKDELARHELNEKTGLRTVMNSGLSPVLVFMSKDEAQEDYLVEHAGLSLHPQKKLADLITKRAAEGWLVSAAFEDEKLSPCVIFRRSLAN